MPDDPTPLGDAMTHRFNDQKIPEPKKGSYEKGSHERKDEVDVSKRPPLPEHRQPSASDRTRLPSRERGVAQ
jgi:hypothetical protein